MYRNTPKYKNTAAKITALVCLLSGGALFCFANAGIIVLPSIAQLLGIILIAVAIYIASVYLLRAYTFIIEENNEDSYDFIITEKKGGRDIKVVHFAISDITSVREVNPSNKHQIQAERKSKKRYTYNTLFAANRFIELCASLDDEEYSVFVAYDEKLLAIFRSVLNK